MEPNQQQIELASAIKDDREPTTDFRNESDLMEQQARHNPPTHPSDLRLAILRVIMPYVQSKNEDGQYASKVYDHVNAIMNERRGSTAFFDALYELSSLTGADLKGIANDFSKR